MEQIVLQIAIQVPAVAVVGYVFLQVTRLILDRFGAQLDRVSLMVERKLDRVIEILLTHPDRR